MPGHGSTTTLRLQCVQSRPDNHAQSRPNHRCVYHGSEEQRRREITAVEAYAVNVGVAGPDDGGIAPYVTNHGAVEDVDRMIVRVETDEGITGWGEMRTFLSPEATRAVLEDGIAPWVLGRSPTRVPDASPTRFRSW